MITLGKSGKLKITHNARLRASFCRDSLELQKKKKLMDKEYFTQEGKKKQSDKRRINEK